MSKSAAREVITILQSVVSCHVRCHFADAKHVVAGYGQLSVRQ